MKKPKILIVDDDPNNLEVILEYLGENHENVLYAPNGQIALQLAKRELPDLIIMDWEMPVLNGVEAVKELQKDPTTKAIPIIINSGVRLDAKDLGEALDTGAVDFMPKPLNPIEFNARVKANLRIKEQHETITKLLKQALERKERELASSALLEHEKNNLISKLINQLEKFPEVSDPVVASQLNDIRRQLKTQLNLKKSWDNFRTHFEEVHPSFFLKLNELHGILSPTEKRMSAFVKIGMDNKEIALLTNVEADSVRKSLNRLKKRLDLTVEDNLRDYITQL